MKNKIEKRVVMKILLILYIYVYGFCVFKCLYKVVIYNSVLFDELYKLYKVLIYFECYIECLVY